MAFSIVPLLQLVATTLLTGEKDANTGETIAKGLLASKTMQGGLGLVAIPQFVFPLVDDALPAGWPAASVKLALMVAAFAWLTYGRATAAVPLGKLPGDDSK